MVDWITGAVASTEADLSIAEIEGVIIQLLADKYRVTPQELYNGLIRKGQTLAVDSIVMAKILVDLQQQCHVSIPLNKETADTLKSVVALAKRVSALQAAQTLTQRQVAGL